MDTHLVSYFLIPLGIFAVVLVFWLGDGLTYLYDYKVTKEGVQFLLFRVIPWRRIPFSNIKDVRRTDGKEFYLTAMNLKNRRGQTIRPILLVKKRAWFSKMFLLTPEDPESFVKVVQAHLEGKSDAA